MSLRFLVRPKLCARAGQYEIHNHSAAEGGMIRHWFTRDDAPLTSSFVKRFAPRDFTVDFPRGAMASVVLGASPDSLIVTADFLRRNDLVGLIYESDDSKAHPVDRRELSRDYRNCKLSFGWKSSGLPGLDEINGPTLTIEGRDPAGNARTWYVRLWNYAVGSPTDARIELDFDDLEGGFNLDTDADPVSPHDIDRLFFSLVPRSFATVGGTLPEEDRAAILEISDLRCEGSGSVLKCNDAMVPEHALRMCTAYDDLYNVVPERIVEVIERLGYRKIINHYVGMSHYQRLTSDGIVDPARPLNAAAAAWHAALARAAGAAGFELIFSVSFEIIASACPQQWMQRASDGSPALTGYDPPSALISPANEDAVEYLSRTAIAFVDIAASAQVQPRIQIGEPWWWVTSDNRPCLYDAEAKRSFGGVPPVIADVRGSKDAAQLALLDQAGALLASATGKITAAVKSVRADAQVLILIYTPSILGADRPELYRANLPSAWAYPAFDVLQLEDYEWLTEDRTARIRFARELTDARLHYPPDRQHYLVGFAGSATAAKDWALISRGAGEALQRGVAEVMVWALPQILRDQVTLFDDGDAAVDAFEDVAFPIELGLRASVIPTFSTNVLTSTSGHEYRNVNWSQGRMRFDAGPGLRSDEELKQLIAFFRARRGSAQAFRFRDPYDFSSNEMTAAPTMMDEVIGAGDGVSSTFNLVKSYGAERRRITRPAAQSVVVAIDGLQQQGNWRLGPYGAIVFDDPPPAQSTITAGFEFDVPVRFESDQLEINHSTFLAGEAPSVPMIEIRETVS